MNIVLVRTLNFTSLFVFVKDGDGRTKNARHSYLPMWKSFRALPM